MRLVKACIALAAFAAIFVMPSMASALEITHPTGTRYAGTFIQATNIAHAATPKNTRMEIPGLGNIECTEATLTGHIKTNNGGATVQGEITTAEFRGHPNTVGNNDCNGPLGTVTVTPSHTSDGIHKPSGAPETIKSLPWCITAGAEDSLTVQGGECGKARALTFLFHVTNPALDCVYERVEAVKGTYTTHSSGVAVGTVGGGVNAEFKEVPATASVFCPNTGSLKMAFTLETDGLNPNTDVWIK